MFIDIPMLLLCPNHGLMCRATLGTVPENLAHKPNFLQHPLACLSISLLPTTRNISHLLVQLGWATLSKDMHRTAFQSEM